MTQTLEQPDKLTSLKRLEITWLEAGFSPLIVKACLATHLVKDRATQITPFGAGQIKTPAPPNPKP